MSAIFNVPVSRPFDFGVNFTLIWQLAVVVAASDPVHVFDVIWKFPLIVTPVKFSGVFPMFFIVSICAALVVPSFTDEKFKLAALRLGTGLITCAVSPTVCGLPEALSVIVNMEVEAVGLNTCAEARMPTSIVQLFPGPNVPGIEKI